MILALFCTVAWSYEWQYPTDYQVNVCGYVNASLIGQNFYMVGVNSPVTTRLDVWPTTALLQTEATNGDAFFDWASYPDSSDYRLY